MNIHSKIVVARDKLAFFSARLEALLSQRAFTYLLRLIFLSLMGCSFFWGLHIQLNREARTNAIRIFFAISRGAARSLTVAITITIFLVARTLVALLKDSKIAVALGLDAPFPTLHTAVSWVVIALSGLHAITGCIAQILDRKSWRPGIAGRASILSTGILLIPFFIYMSVAGVRAQAERTRYLHRANSIHRVHHSIAAIICTVLLITHGIDSGRLFSFRWFTPAIILAVLDALYRFLWATKREFDITPDQVSALSSSAIAITVPKSRRFSPGQFYHAMVPSISTTIRPIWPVSDPADENIRFVFSPTDEWSRMVCASLSCISPASSVRVILRGPFGTPAKFDGRFERYIFVSQYSYSRCAFLSIIRHLRAPAAQSTPKNDPSTALGPTRIAELNQAVIRGIAKHNNLNERQAGGKANFDEKDKHAIGEPLVISAHLDVFSQKYQKAKAEADRAKLEKEHASAIPDLEVGANDERADNMENASTRDLDTQLPVTGADEISGSGRDVNNSNHDESEVVDHVRAKDTEMEIQTVVSTTQNSEETTNDAHRTQTDGNGNENGTETTTTRILHRLENIAVHKVADFASHKLDDLFMDKLVPETAATSKTSDSKDGGTAGGSETAGSKIVHGLERMALGEASTFTHRKLDELVDRVAPENQGAPKTKTNDKEDTNTTGSKDDGATDEPETTGSKMIHNLKNDAIEKASSLARGKMNELFFPERPAPSTPTPKQEKSKDNAIAGKVKMAWGNAEKGTKILESLFPNVKLFQKIDKWMGWIADFRLRLLKILQSTKASFLNMLFVLARYNVVIVGLILGVSSARMDVAHAKSAVLMKLDLALGVFVSITVTQAVLLELSCLGKNFFSSSGQWVDLCVLVPTSVASLVYGVWNIATKSNVSRRHTLTQLFLLLPLKLILLGYRLHRTVGIRTLMRTGKFEESMLNPDDELNLFEKEEPVVKEKPSPGIDFLWAVRDDDDDEWMQEELKTYEFGSDMRIVPYIGENAVNRGLVSQETRDKNPELCRNWDEIVANIVMDTNSDNQIGVYICGEQVDSTVAKDFLHRNEILSHLRGTYLELNFPSTLEEDLGTSDEETLNILRARGCHIRFALRRELFA